MTNKTDKELLELAAKAAGYQLQRMRNPVESGYVGSEFFHMNGRYWNPLTDNGDAFRLEVDMRMKVDIRAMVTTVEPYIFNENAETIFEFHGDSEEERFSATRRAIVKAAAYTYERSLDNEK